MLRNRLSIAGMLILPVAYLIGVLSIGLGSTWDSGVYSTMALSLVRGLEAPTDGSYPAGLSLVVSALHLVSGNLTIDFSIVNAFSILLGGFAGLQILNRISDRKVSNYVIALGVQVTLLSGPAILFAWTEPLFTAVSLMAINRVHGDLKSKKFSWTTVLWLSLVPVIRYVGIYVVLLLVIWIIINQIRSHGTAKLLKLAAKVALVFVPLLVQTVVNQITLGYFAGPRDPSRHSLAHNVWAFISVLGHAWFSVIIFWLVAALLLLVFKQLKPLREFRITNHRDEAFLLAIFLIQTAALIYSESTIAIDPIDKRMIYPELPVAWLAVTILLAKLIKDQKSALRFAVLTASVLAMAVTGVSTWSLFISDQVASQGPADSPGYRLNSELGRLNSQINDAVAPGQTVFYLGNSDPMANSFALDNRDYLFRGCTRVPNFTFDKWQITCGDGQAIRTNEIDLVTSIPNTAKSGAVLIVDLSDNPMFKEPKSGWNKLTTGTQISVFQRVSTGQ